MSFRGAQRREILLENRQLKISPFGRNDKKRGFRSDTVYCEALNQGVTHFVLPGNRPNDIRRYMTKVLSQGGGALSLLMPGIGSQGGQIQEAFDAAAGYRCYAIVGSAIYGASDPLKALLDFTEQVKSYAPPIGPERAP